MKVIRDVITEGTSILKNSDSSSETPFLDAVIILADTLKISKEKLLASYPDSMEDNDYTEYIKLIEKRRNNYPVAYLTGKKEFFGLPFQVDKRVLVPRPDTETLVETTLEILNANPSMTSVLDLCTGSGAIGISLKNSIQSLSTTCSDISDEAIEVCRENSKSILGYEIPIIESDLFSNIEDLFDIIVTNPPYLTDSETLKMMNNGWKEPAISLKGGYDGLDFIRKIISEAPDYLKPKGYLIIESSIDQTEKIADILISENYTGVNIIKDLTGRNRVTLGQRGSK